MRVTYDEIIAFWYSDEMEKHWFSSTPEIDLQIRERFHELWNRASKGERDEWKSTPGGCLALVILLDQLPLNMYRGEARSFCTEQQAIEITRHAIDQKFDQQLPKERLSFLYMPLMHSEHLADQDLSVQLFQAAGLQANTDFARHHREIVARFGRFPHRNAILGRENTPEESAYLASEEAFHG